MSVNAIWRFCGFDDPQKDKICVWLVYEKTDAHGRTMGIRKSLAVYDKGRYKVLSTRVGDDEKYRYGTNIMWSYVLDEPALPPLSWNGDRWTICPYDPDEFLE